MDATKQLLLIELLCSNTQIFNLCNCIIEKEYFSTPYDKIIQFIKKYYTEYKNIPNQIVLKVETGIEIKIHDNLTKDIIDWACVEIEQFCRTQAMRLILLDAPKLLASNNDGLILQQWQKASQISLSQQTGHDYLNDVEERTKELSKPNQIISTGIPLLDKACNPQRQELHMVMGNSGGGKSITLGNIAHNGMIEGYHVLIISLELKEIKIAQRIDSIVSGYNPKEYHLYTDEINQALRDFKEIVTGSLYIERIKPYSNCNAVRSAVERYKVKFGRNPDIIVVDYMGRLVPIDRSIAAEHIKDERVSDELREIAVDYDAVLWTGSQMNRNTVKTKVEDIGQDNVAGGIAKLNPVDSAVVVVFNDVMKFYGEIAFKPVKCRNSEDTGLIIYCDWINRSMRIAFRSENISKLSGKAKDLLTNDLKQVDNMMEEAKKPSQTPSSSILDKFFVGD